jgi:hypothetical protein
MTTLGKIIVVVNLVFSLVTGALIVMVYATRTNWHAEYVKRVDEQKALQSNYQSLAKKLEDERTLASKALEPLQTQIANLTRERDAALAEAQVKGTEGGTAMKNANASRGSAVAAAEEAKLLQQEVVKLQKDVAKRDEKVFAYETEAKTLRDRAVSAEIAYKSEQERARELLNQVMELTKSNQEMKVASRGAALSGGAGGVASTSLKPPPEDVRCSVMEVDPKTGYVTLSAGSDAGLAKGHVLEVYRTRPEAKYLGKLQIVDARPHEAVARPVAQRGSLPIQKGDTVASSILPPR